MTRLLGYGSFLLPVLPVTLVPRPAFSGGSGSEVGAAQVHDTGGEAQETAVSVGPVHPGSRGGQAVLLISAGQQVEGSVLQVGRLLDELGIQYKVRSSYRGHKLILLPLHKMYERAHMFAGFGLTFDTRDSCSSTISSSGTVDVSVSATLLDGHLGTYAVSSTQNHLSSI